MPWHFYDKSYRCDKKLQSLVRICLHRIMMSQCHYHVTSQEWPACCVLRRRILFCFSSKQSWTNHIGKRICETFLFSSTISAYNVLWILFSVTCVYFGNFYSVISLNHHLRDRVENKKLNFDAFVPITPAKQATFNFRFGVIKEKLFHGYIWLNPWV